MRGLAFLWLSILAFGCSSNDSADATAPSDSGPVDSGFVQDTGFWEDTGYADSAVLIDTGVDAGPVDTGPADPCDTAQCDVHATCSSTTGVARCQCQTGYTGDGQTCTAVAGQLDGLRWELPCVSTSTDRVCVTPGLTVTSTTLSGASGARYVVTLRFRGVVEERTYLEGSGAGFFHVGGPTPDRGDPFNIYSLHVSSPDMTYYLNSGTSNQFKCAVIDYTAEIRMDAGAVVTLTADPVDFNLEEIKNVDADGNPQVVPGIPPAPDAYDGQFVQMDVVGVRLAL